MPIVRLIAESTVLSAGLSAGVHALEAAGFHVASADPLPAIEEVFEFTLEGQGPEVARQVLDRHFTSADLLVTAQTPQVPQVFVSDMDSTMIAAECIDEIGRASWRERV